MKPGKTTTEFLLAVLAMALGVVAFVLGYYLEEGHWAVQAVGLGIAGLAALGYGKGRAMVKAATALPNAPDPQ